MINLEEVGVRYSTNYNSRDSTHENSLSLLTEPSGC